MGTVLRLIVVLVLCCPAWGAIGFGSAANCNTSTAASTCNITLSPSTGAVVVVGVSIRTTTSSVSSITDGHSGTYKKFAERNNSTNARVELWVNTSSPASVTTITVNLTGGTTKFVGTAAYYTGVSAIGNVADVIQNVNAMSDGITTNDANNWVVQIGAGSGAGTISAGAGNLRTSAVTSGGGGSAQVSGELVDNTTASAATTVLGRATVSAIQASASAAIELRTVSPGAGIAHVRTHQSQAWPTTTSAAETIYEQATAGNLLIITASANNSSTTVSLSDSNGSLSTAINNATVTNVTTSQFYQANSSSGAHTFTITIGTSSTNEIIIDEFSGLATASPLDVTAGPSACGTSPTSANATTTNANDLLYGAMADSSSSVTFTAGTGYTLLNNPTGIAAGSGGQIDSESQIVTATGTYAATGTYGSSQTCAAILSTWKQAGGVVASCTESIALLGVGCR